MHAGLTSAERRQLAELPGRIAALEAEVKAARTTTKQVRWRARARVRVCVWTVWCAGAEEGAGSAAHARLSGPAHDGGAPPARARANRAAPPHNHATGGCARGQAGDAARQQPAQAAYGAAGRRGGGARAGGRHVRGVPPAAAWLVPRPPPPPRMPLTGAARPCTRHQHTHHHHNHHTHTHPPHPTTHTHTQCQPGRAAGRPGPRGVNAAGGGGPRSSTGGQGRPARQAGPVCACGCGWMCGARRLCRVLWGVLGRWSAVASRNTPPPPTPHPTPHRADA
jgi:hypothetical protein